MHLAIAEFASRFPGAGVSGGLYTLRTDEQHAGRAPLSILALQLLGERARVNQQILVTC